MGEANFTDPAAKPTLVKMFISGMSCSSGEDCEFAKLPQAPQLQVGIARLPPCYSSDCEILPCTCTWRPAHVCPKSFPKSPSQRWVGFTFFSFRGKHPQFSPFSVGGARIGTFWSWSWLVGANFSTSSSETSPSTRWKRATWQQGHQFDGSDLIMKQKYQIGWCWRWLFFEWFVFVLGGSCRTRGNSFIEFYWDRVIAGYSYDYTSAVL